MVKLARVLDFPRSEIYYDDMEKMNFKITYTLRAKRVERWIRAVRRDFLDAAEIKVVSLDCEFTDPRKGNQRAVVLQLSVAQHTLVFHIMHADEVPQMLIDFLADKNIKFCGAAIHNDVNMLQTHGISIPPTINLQQILQNPVPRKQTPSLIDLANHYIGADLEQKKFNYNKNKPSKTAKALEEEALIFGWGDFPLSHKQLQYAALDARLDFELGRRHFRALGYNSHMDRLELNIYE
ncbi:hypothetical protein QYE76_068399 [Lolium multiflorum]|uniref:3'-5' exonuclease domain-containing protein n=1 Tax=Lolium multiflorum TaxID=4521 RepID=A0AAD8SEQ7_LOLMU|nr:hypothetical protein QYE76_068399 [Lolium multiflorum]